MLSNGSHGTSCGYDGTVLSIHRTELHQLVVFKSGSSFILNNRQVVGPKLSKTLHVYQIKHRISPCVHPATSTKQFKRIYQILILYRLVILNLVTKTYRIYMQDTIHNCDTQKLHLALNFL